MNRTRKTPLVTGISPKEGPPGTRVTIRGEFLGASEKDLRSVKICGNECLLTAEWQSQSKIIARTGISKQVGEVIVETYSGGLGTCTVNFKGYLINAGPLQESAVWIDETHTVGTQLDVRKTTTSSMLVSDNLLGLSDESSEKKYPLEKLSSLFPDSVGDISQDNFSSQWYLLENHHCTSFEDLKAGLHFLKHRSTSDSVEPNYFFKSNLNTFMECMDKLEEMKDKQKSDEEKGDFSVPQLETRLTTCKSDADLLFQGILSRKDKADSTRSALGLHNRFRFLFYLPGSLRANIKKGEYDVVINDYTRGKLLFGDTEVELFKKVFNEVERIIEEFRGQLYAQLTKLPNYLEEKTKLIRYLIDLEYPGNPAWECITREHEWIQGLLKDCMQSFVEKERDDVNFIVKPQPVPSKTRSKYNIPLVFIPDVRDASFFRDSKAAKFKVPAKVSFVEGISTHLAKHFPDFCRLGFSYLQGNLRRKEKDERRVMALDSKHLQKFQEMMGSLMQLYSHLVRAAFLPDSLEGMDRRTQVEFGAWLLGKEDMGCDWLPQCVRSVRNCADSLSHLDLGTDTSDLIHDLVFDLRIDTMRTIFKKAETDIKNLYLKETWVLETNDKYGGTTQLPTLFESIVIDALSHLSEVVMKSKPQESDIFDETNVQAEATMLCVSLVTTFVNCLKVVAFDEDSTIDTNMEGAEFEPELTKERRLIISLSNCHQTIERVLPRLMEAFDKHGYPETNRAWQIAQEKCRSLDDSLFEAYIDAKINAIIGSMEVNMYGAKFDWSTCKEPRGVASYVKEVLCDIVHVHSEIYSISPVFVTRVLTRIVTNVMEEFSRLIVSIPKFNKHGALQARIDLQAFSESVFCYIAEESEACIQEALHYLPTANSREEQRIIDPILEEFKRNFKFYLNAFKQEDPLDNRYDDRELDDGDDM